MRTIEAQNVSQDDGILPQVPFCDRIAFCAVVRSWEFQSCDVRLLFGILGGRFGLDRRLLIRLLVDTKVVLRQPCVYGGKPAGVLAAWARKPVSILYVFEGENLLIHR
jgi:hypothetical protein